jgi:ribosome-binding protein aMBF1 (putative translation factor)
MNQLKNGWVEGSVQDFMNLSDADMEFIETRRALAREVRTWRQEQGLTQTALAARLKTSQSRVAKMEAADATVSIDLLLLQTLFRLGMRRRQLAKAI